MWSSKFIHRTSTAGRQHSASRGFTLIEILVVVVILGICAAIVIPQIGSRDDLKVASASRVLIADLIYAQNLSISNQQMHYVRFDTTAQTYEVLSAITPTAVQVTHPVNLSPFLVKFGSTGQAPLKDCSINAVNFNTGQVTIGFDELGTPFAYTPGSGTAAMTSGSMQLKAGTQTMTVTVEPFTGELRVN